MSYPTKIDRFTSNRLGVGRGSKNFGNAGAPPRWDGTVVTLINMLLPHLSYNANFGHSRSSRSNVIMEIYQKILTLRTTHFLLLLFYSNNGPISYRFRDFLTPVHLTPPLRGSWEFL